MKPDYDRDALHKAIANFNQDMDRREEDLLGLLLLAAAILLVVLLALLRGGVTP